MLANVLVSTHVSAAALVHVPLGRPAVSMRASSVSMVDSWYDAGVRLEAYYCNDQGCWVGEAPAEAAPVAAEIKLSPIYNGGKSNWVGYERLYGRSNPRDVLVESKGVVTPTKRKPAPTGIFAPVVLGAKAVLGTKELNTLRAKVIEEHSKVIGAFVDTSESAFGQIVLKRMFEAADKDGNGTLDKEEIRDALKALGFTFIEDKQLDKIMDRGDVNDDQVIDFEEFVVEAPKSLRMSLVKLAKRNGHDLGFLA